MKRSLLFMAGCLLLLSSCVKSVTGDGPVVTESRQVGLFNTVTLDGSATVEVIRGSTQKVTVTGYANLVPIFETGIRNGELRLKFESGYINVRRNNIKVLVEVPDIQSVSSNGSGDFLVRNFTNGAILNAHINGSGSISILGSSFDRASFSINGSGDIKASGSQAKDAEAEIHGSGNIELTCLQNLKVRISGSGNVDYYGNPFSTDVNVSGSGKARRR